MLNLFSRIVFLFGIFLGLIVSSWGINYIHDPYYIFDKPYSLTRAPIPSRTTNAVNLHLGGNKGGKAKNGRIPTVAIIDTDFNPDHTKRLADKGVIHPSALKKLNPYVLTPNEETRPAYNDPMYAQKIARSALKNTITAYGALNHGSAVMQDLHDIAPESRILPIDLKLYTNGPQWISGPEAMARAIRAAIAQKVDVINLSLRFCSNSINSDTIEALKEAVQKGIIIVKAAGNDGINNLWDMWDNFWGFFRKSKTQEVYEKLKGKGILFVGSLRYDRHGQEEISNFSQLPNPDDKNKKPHFLFAPGEDLRLPIENKKNTFTSGTSFSAPTAAGGALLLLKHAWDKGYAVNSEDILNIMERSGRDITYYRWWPFSNVNYKSLDLSAAQALLDRKFKPGAKPALSPAPVVKKLVSKPSPTKKLLSKNKVKKQKSIQKKAQKKQRKLIKKKNKSKKRKKSSRLAFSISF